MIATAIVALFNALLYLAQALLALLLSILAVLSRLAGLLSNALSFALSLLANALHAILPLLHGLLVLLTLLSPITALLFAAPRAARALGGDLPAYGIVIYLSLLITGYLIRQQFAPAQFLAAAILIGIGGLILEVLDRYSWTLVVAALAASVVYHQIHHPQESIHHGNQQRQYRLHDDDQDRTLGLYDDPLDRPGHVDDAG